MQVVIKWIIIYVDNQTMRNIVIVNTLFITEYAFKELLPGKTSLDLGFETALKISECSSRVILAEEGTDTSSFPDGFEIAAADKSSVTSLIKTLTDLSSGFDNIFYLHADCPLIDLKLAENMYANHLKYFAEYTFADGYPAGLSLEIIKSSILPALETISLKHEIVPGRKALFSVIEKEINSFDLETQISPEDMRLYRINLFPDTKRNFILLQKMIGLIGSMDVDAELPFSDKVSEKRVLDIIREHGSLLRTLPAFCEVETTAGSAQQVAYLPDNGTVLKDCGITEMETENFRLILDKLSAFSGDMTVSLSVRNEPSQHSRIDELAALVLEKTDFGLLIETSGIGWDEQRLKNILSMDSSRITWIVDLDALDQKIYTSLRGGGYNEAYRTAEFLLSVSPANTWVQAVRMKQNEEDIEHFYKYWKEKTNNVIIQKYDWYCGRLEQMKVSDLSPVKRLPCWHMKRDMIVLIDGTVPLCREDLEAGISFGNILNEDIEIIWKNGAASYEEQLRGEYRGICLECDEYYTFNY